VPLFSEPDAADDRPRRFSEPLSAFLMRSTREDAVKRRAMIEDWFNRLCSGLQSGVSQRLQSRDDQDFTAGFWELYLHETFRCLGYSVECEPELPNGRRIDFLLRRGGDAFYLEATIARKSKAEQAADARRHRILDGLNQTHTTNFMLGITIESAGGYDLPKVSVLRKRLEAWLADLDPEDAARLLAEEGEVPEFRWTDGRAWSFVFEAVPSKPEYRGVPADGAIGMLMDETGGLINDERSLRHALKEKRPSGYGTLSLPYVVAVCEAPFLFGDTESHRTNVLYGHNAIQYSQGPGPKFSRPVRLADGFWWGPGDSPLNRRVAAVLLASHLSPWSVASTELEWWENPFAEQAVPELAVPEVAHRRRIAVDSAGRWTLHREVPVRSPASVLQI
jgi:hypothetical protein